MRPLLVLLSTLSLTACIPAYEAPTFGSVPRAPGHRPETAPDEGMETESGAVLPPDFLEASEATGVPAELLFAIARVETRLQMVAGSEEFPGHAAGHGVMGLRGAHLDLAAELTGQDVALVRTDREANVLAAASLLAHWARTDGLATDDIDSWAEAVARYGGILHEEGAREYVHYEVYQALAEGIEIEGFFVPPLDVDPDYGEPMSDGARGYDGGTLWTPSPNYNSRGASSVDFVVIHTCEGSYSGCWSWLTNPASGVSAHYVVNDTGTEVRALVDENDRAWHVAADYDCDNNDGVECWRNGSSMNTISVGIEHAGYASQTHWDEGLINRSAAITCGITERHDVPRDSYHIVGHGQLQPWNRTDPGAHWPWADYLAEVRSACDGGAVIPDPEEEEEVEEPAEGASFIIDSNNAANNTRHYYSEVSGGWWASANVAGYWNTGYWVAPTDGVSDPASFWFLANDGECAKVESWWPAAWDRPPAITFLGWDAEEREVGRAVVDQTRGHAQWNLLGHWRFTPGWNRVLLSRWAAAGDYAVADAVRISRSTRCD